jgi:hypothetical protein
MAESATLREFASRCESRAGHLQKAKGLLLVIAFEISS